MGLAFLFNANGNVTARGSDTFSYDQANRLKTATINGASSSYTYDGDGKRTSKTVGGTTTSFVYDVASALPDVLTDGTRKYVYGLGLAYTVDSSGTLEVAHFDGLGAVRALTDGSGSVVQTYETDPFGEPTQTSGSSLQPFPFTGQQRSSESGLVQLRARMYDPYMTVGEYSMPTPYRQVLLTEEQLRGGLSRISYKEVPGHRLAYLAIEPSELERRLGITFQDSFDDLDELKLAVLELRSGKRIALIRHRGLPSQLVELHVSPEVFNKPDVIDEILPELGLTQAEVSWERPLPGRGLT